MAIIRPSSLVESISGKIGNIVFRTRGKKTVAYNMPISVHNPSSRSQSKIRNIFANFKILWSNLTNESKNLWNEYAKSREITPDQIGTYFLIKPPGRNLSGYNAFLGVNTRLKSVDLDAVTIPPLYSTESPIGITSSIKSSSRSIIVKINLSESTEKGAILRLFVKGKWENSYPYCCDYVEIKEDDITEGFIEIPITFIRTGSGSNYFDMPLSYFFGKEIEFQADIVSVTGAKSVSSNIHKEVIMVTGGDNINTIFSDCTAAYKSDLLTYSELVQYPKWTPELWFRNFIIMWCTDNNEDYNTITKGELELAGCPTNVADTVDEGYLPSVPGISDLTKNW